MNFQDLNFTNGCFDKKFDCIEQELYNTDDYIRLEKRKNELFEKIKASSSREGWLFVDELVSIKNEEFVCAAEFFYKMGINDAFGTLIEKRPEHKM